MYDESMIVCLSWPMNIRNSGANPFVSEGFNSRVICWYIAGLVYEAVSISCLVVLYVSIAPLAELQL